MTAQQPAPFVVGVAPSGRLWRGDLQRHIRDHETDVVVRVVRDLDGARHDELDVLVVDDDTSFLSLPLVADLNRQGVGVVGVFDPHEAEGHGRHHLEQMGVGAQIDGGLDPGLLLHELRSHRRDPVVTFGFEAVMGGSSVAPASHPGRRGPIVAVGGAPGVGRTEVAIALASSLSRPGARWLLVDADDVGPSVARRLGLPLHPNLVTALEIQRGVQIQVEGDPVANCFERAVAPAGNRLFDVVTGIINRRDWSLLDPDEIEFVLEEFRRRGGGIVLDCGPLVEDLERWVDRFACARASLALANRVVGVLDGSPAGLVRFLDWLDDVGDLDVGPVVAVVNRSPGGSRQRLDLERELRACAGARVTDIVHAPVDGRVARAAWDATPVTRGPFRRSVDGLARLLQAVLPHQGTGFPDQDVVPGEA
ncbi:MAG: tyrosine-protein kinase family protein [Actinomycetia bacterium]|nr:tyrosine-protein kinase family protein [Actinomycetes bacterium]